MKMTDHERIVKEYTDKPIEEIRPLGHGHINETMYVKAGEEYVLQRLCHDIFLDHLYDLEIYYLEYRKSCKRVYETADEWICPEWIKDKSGQYFYRDEQSIWRMYRYIESDGYDPDNIDPYVIGEGLGKMDPVLREMPKEEIRAVFPHLHDLRYYYNEYLKQVNSKRTRIKEIDSYIAMYAEKFMDVADIGGYVIHGDAKPDNMIFRNGKVAGFIDLDTLMTGSPFDDMADAMRYCCEEGDHIFSSIKTVRFFEGYQNGSDTYLTEDAEKMAVKVYARNRFMLGLRYYTDYLSDNEYFKGITEKERLERAADLLFVE